MSQTRITGLERWLAHVQYVNINTYIFRFKSMYSRPQVKFSHVICEYNKYMIYDILCEIIEISIISFLEQNNLILFFNPLHKII